jgi:hypothetical protein
MFTIKLYDADNFRQRILEAESFTVLRMTDGTVEITLHGMRRDGDLCDNRFDLRPGLQAGGADDWSKAIIENASGKTTEIIYRGDEFTKGQSSPPLQI